MQKELVLDESSRTEKEKRTIIILATIAIISLIGAIVVFNFTGRFTNLWLNTALFWLFLIGFIISSIIFLIKFRRFREGTKPVKEVVAKTKTDLPKQRVILILLALLMVLSIVIIILSSVDIQLICQEMACIPFMLGSFLVLIGSVAFMIVRIIKYRDSKRRIKMDSASQESQIPFDS